MLLFVFPLRSWEGPLRAGEYLFILGGKYYPRWT